MNKRISVSLRLIAAGVLLAASFAVVPAAVGFAANATGDAVVVGDLTSPVQNDSTVVAGSPAATSTILDPVTITTQDPTTAFTPKQQLRANRLNTQYKRLRGDTYGLRFLFSKAAGYRRAYLTFLYGEQFHKRNTTVLEDGLDLFDTFIQHAKNNQQRGLVDLGYPNGFDISGKNVTNLDTVESEIHTGLPDYLTARFEVSTAIFAMHSALNLYSQITGLATPSVPKLRLPLYCLACATDQ